MGHTERFSLLTKHKILTQTFIEKKQTLEEKLNHFVQTKSSLNGSTRELIRKELVELLEIMMADLRIAFPEGGYIKNYGEFGTADLGTQITTFSTPPKPIVDEFLRRFEQALTEIYEMGLTFDSPEFQERLLINIWELGATFLNRLLIDDSKLLVQSRVKIAKTALGAPLEMRVDFIDGEPVHSRARFSTEYLPQETQGASDVIKNFFARAPEKFRYLTGGADVALLEDGSWTIIEFNFGSSSGTLNPYYFPIDANLFYTKLQGFETPFLRDLDRVFHGGLEEQINYLEQLKNVRPLFWKPKITDISVTEVGKYFRDLYLEKYNQNPTSENAEKTLASIREMLSPWKDQEDVRNIIKSAEYYLHKRVP